MQFTILDVFIHSTRRNNRDKLDKARSSTEIKYANF